MNRPAAILGALLLWTQAMAAQPYVSAASLGMTMREQVLKCWRADPYGHRQTFTVDFHLARDGSLMGKPSLHPGPSAVPGKAIAGAIRAIERCAPYRLPPEYYDRWKNQEMTFFSGFL